MKKLIIVIGIIALLFILLLASVGVWAYYEFLYTEPLTEQEVAEVTPDWDLVTRGNWSPWYDTGDGTTEWNPAGSYNAWLASVPEEDKAWPILIEAYYDHLDSVFHHDLFTEHAGTLPEHPERWGLYLKLIETDEVGQLCQKLVDASTRPVLGCELLSSTDPYEHAAMLEHNIEDDDWNTGAPRSEGLWDTNLSWLGKLRQATNLLNARAAYELERGNTDAYIELIESINRLGRLNWDIPILISSLVDIAMQSVVHRSMDWALVNHADAFNETHLARFDALFSGQEQTSINWAGEQLFFHDSVRRMCDEQGRLSATMFANVQFSGPACSLPIQDLSASAQRLIYVQHLCFAQGELLASIPWDESVETMDAVLARERDSLNKLGDVTLDVMMPAIDSAAGRVRSYRQQALGTRLAIAAYSHRLRHGAFPDSIDTFDKDLIGFNPIDAFTGEALRYRVVDDRPLIYSLGDDRTDDNGLIRWERKEVGELGDEMQIRVRTWPKWLTTQEAAVQRLNVPESIVGDWVLFPMPVDEPEPIYEREEDEYDG
ncbi:MAG: hypothetical protein ACF8MF_01405 [Phycisphaerales bacterium JB052]